MDDVSKLREKPSKEWYDLGRKAAKDMTKDEAQNVIWNLGYFRQGIMDANADSVMERNTISEVDDE